MLLLDLLALLGIIIGSVGCSFQSDSKALAAYSSVTHMSFLLLSLIIFCIAAKTRRLIII